MSVVHPRLTRLATFHDGPIRQIFLEPVLACLQLGRFAPSVVLRESRRRTFQPCSARTGSVIKSNPSGGPPCRRTAMHPCAAAMAAIWKEHGLASDTNNLDFAVLPQLGRRSALKQPLAFRAQPLPSHGGRPSRSRAPFRHAPACRSARPRGRQRRRRH